MNKSEWILKRKEVITATDIGAICGLSPYRSPFDIWTDKIREDLPTEVSNTAMTWGNRLEPVIALAYTEQYGIKLKKAEFVRKNLEGVPAGCTQDYISEDGKINVEIKTAGSGLNWGNPGTDEIPDYYLTQVTWQMGIAGQEITHIAVLIGASDFRIYNVGFNKEFFESLLTSARDFWILVQTKKPPIVDGSIACRQYLSHLYQKGSKQLIENPSEIITSNTVKYFKLHRLEEMIKTKKEELTNEIISQVGDFGGVKIDGLGKLSLVRVKDKKTVSYKSVVEQLKSSVQEEIFNSVMNANTKTADNISLRVYPEKE